MAFIQIKKTGFWILLLCLVVPSIFFIRIFMMTMEGRHSLEVYGLSFLVALIFLLAIVWLLIKRKRNLEEIKLLISSLNAAANAVVITDPQGKIQWVNQAFTKINGYSAKEAIGKTPRLVKSGKTDKSLYENLWATILKGEVWHGELVNRRKNGSFYVEDLTITPIQSAHGVTTHFVGIGQDITAKKEAEKRAKEATHAKSEFISMVSHELRTPMAVIKGSVDMLLDGLVGSLSSEQQEWLLKSKRNIDRLTRLVNSVLDYQKLDADSEELKFDRHNLNDLVRETVEHLKILATQKNLNIVLDLLEPLPDVLCDKDLITQVLFNLTSNAIKFTPKKEEAGTVWIRTQNGDNWVRVSVEDEGPGIRREDLSLLFKRFSKISLKEDNPVAGTGLGLAISKKIIEKHHGKINVESVYQKGSTFYFVLPIVERREQEVGGR